MAIFYARVELHDVEPKDESYTVLHKAMAAIGYTRTVKADNDKTYKLPTGLYRLESTDDKMGVLKSTKTAAQTTGKKSWIIVIENGGAALSLEEVRTMKRT